MPLFRSFGLLVILLFHDAALATVLPVDGTLALRVRAFGGSFSTAAVFGQDSLQMNLQGFAHVTRAEVAAGFFPGGSTVFLPITDPGVFPVAGALFRATNGAGSLDKPPAGPLAGAIPFQGFMKVCLFGGCGSSANIQNIEVPLSVVGQGGTVHRTGSLNVTVIGAPWTTGTAAVGSVTSQGSAMGPAGQASSTALPGGSMNLVSPVFISTNLGAAQLVPTFARLGFEFADVALQCDDGLDNDGDGLIDFPADPGCSAESANREDAKCQDGLDNDGDGSIDFDGGASVNGGVPLAAADAQCATSHRNREVVIIACGVGGELVVVLAALWLWRRHPAGSGGGTSPPRRAHPV
jgi:hypothetical protein